MSNIGKQPIPIPEGVEIMQNETEITVSGKLGKLKQVSVGTEGDIWGVQSNGSVYKWNGETWDVQPGQLKQISVGKNNDIWGVSVLNTIYKWNGKVFK